MKDIKCLSYGKSQDLTVKKLTRNNQTMKKKFNDLNNFEDEVA